MVLFYASWKSFGRFRKTLIPLLGLDLAHALPSMSIYIFLGYFADATLISAFGLSNSFLYVMIFPMMNAIIEVSGVLFAINYAAKNYNKLIQGFYHAILSLFLFMFVYLVLTIFSEQIFIFCGTEADVAKMASFLFRWSVGYTFFALISKFFQAFMSAQGKVRDFLFINYFGLIFGIILCGVFMIYYDMKQTGIIVGITIQEGIIATYSFFVFCTRVDSKTVGRITVNEVLDGFWSFSQRICTNVIAAILENIAFEVNTFMAIQLKNKKELAVYFAWDGLAEVFFRCGDGFSSAIRVIIGGLVGEGKKDEIRQEIMAIFFYIFLISVVNCSLLLTFHSSIAWLFIEEVTMAASLSQVIKVLAFAQWSYMMIYPVFQVMRIFELEKFFATIMGSYFLFSDVCFVLILAFYLKMSSIGVVIGHALANTTSLMIFFKKIFCDIKFDEITNLNLDDSDNIEESQKLVGVN